VTIAPSLRATLATVVVILVLLCAGGLAEAAMLLMDHARAADCDSSARQAVPAQCRATALELPVVVLPDVALTLARPQDTGMAPRASGAHRAPGRRVGPLVPRSPPLA
jgi:hypothetical protein